MTEKKQINQEAIGEVRMVNQDILGSLTGISPYKQGGYDYRNKTAEQIRRDDSRDYVATSHFDWRPSQEPNQGSGFGITNENSDLKNRLN